MILIQYDLLIIILTIFSKILLASGKNWLYSMSSDSEVSRSFISLTLILLSFLPLWPMIEDFTWNFSTWRYEKYFNEKLQNYFNEN